MRRNSTEDQHEAKRECQLEIRRNCTEEQHVAQREWQGEIWRTMADEQSNRVTELQRQGTINMSGTVHCRHTVFVLFEII